MRADRFNEGNYVNELKGLSCRHEDVASSMSPCKECVSFNQYKKKCLSTLIVSR